MLHQRKTIFNLPYAGIDVAENLAILYGEKGDLSTVIEIGNPVLQYSADSDAYTNFHSLFLNAINILGEGCIIQKQDLLIRKKYESRPSTEFLKQKYNEHFEDREYTCISTFLIITRRIKKGAFYVYDAKQLNDFHQNAIKVFDLLSGGNFKPRLLSKHEIDTYVNKLLAMDFNSAHIALNNIKSGGQHLQIGSKLVRMLSIINTDSIDLPEQISPYITKQDNGGLKDFPVDNFSFLHNIPECELALFNQVIEIPSQQITLGKLEAKKKRHSGIPDPANLLCVEDISQLLRDVARDNQLLVNAHYSILVCSNESGIDKACNFIESELFKQGIIPSRNAYNQLELFRSTLPGNAVELKSYDWFLTTADAALCLYFKECLPLDDPSDFLIYFTDRQGVPVGIDLADLPMKTNRINNRNKFVIGPSGSGKSFFMNALIEQYMHYNMDVVIVDTGHSYSGLCSYYNGKYITYSEKDPITMNPFQIEESEYNIEKKDFLCTLIGLLWKGVDGMLSNVERDVISNLISAYYANYFSPTLESANIQELSFNTFYEFAMIKIPLIKQQERIPFDLDEFRYVLKKFYTDGEFQTILNKASDRSLFAERFIVFEIDSIKENRILFPIVTLVIMDVFIQKMRHREDQRKALIVEEAWKAIASPLMAEYLLFLYKTVRKFWGEAIVVTQELSDILGNAVVKDSILNNSDTVCLLDQSKFKDSYEAIAKLLSITETEQKKIFTINKLNNNEGRGRFKEVYIRRGSHGEVYGVEVSIFQYLAFTTEKPEKNAVQAYVKEFGSYQRALSEFVSAYQRSGLSLGDFVNRVNSKGVQPQISEYFKLEPS